MESGAEFEDIVTIYWLIISIGVVEVAAKLVNRSLSKVLKESEIWWDENWTQKQEGFYLYTLAEIREDTPGLEKKEKTII